MSHAIPTAPATASAAPTRRLRRTLATAATAAAATLVAGIGLVAGGAPASAAGRTIYVSPGVDFNRVLPTLRAGDHLRLRPGTYRAGYVRPRLASGTAAAPIVVEAADARRKPLVQGIFKLFDANYWTLQNLRIQATQHSFEALYMGGGTGWKVIGSEFFGARTTQSYSNVSIADDLSRRPPRNFLFEYNCVHGASRLRVGQDHNIYVLFTGAARQHGAIYRNIVFDHPYGEGVKLGVGGAAGARGPWGVWVGYNTISNGGRQVLMTGDVRYNSVVGNVLTNSTMPFHADPRTTSMYMNLVSTRTNRAVHNWVSASSMVWFDPTKKIVNQGDNALRPSPGWSGYGSCSGFRMANAAAASYGRYGTGRF